MAKSRRPAPAPTPPNLLDGLVVSAHGRHCVVESDDGSRRICHPRGKKNTVVVGDEVRWSAPPPGQGEEGSIEQVQPRRNLFYRQDEMRTKAFAANIDQVLIWIAAEPEFSHKLLARALIAADAAGIRPRIVLNKADLTEAHARGWERLEPYRAMQYDTLAVSLTEHAADDPALAQLQQWLQGSRTLVLGPSGTGKSTLINWLLPDANAQVGEISQALNSGRHTTTNTRWYWLDRASGTAVIDSPGFQEFGLRHIAPADLASWMPDLRQHVPQCKFYNCTHLHEPGCGVLAAVDQPVSTGGIHPLRHKLYAELFEELSQVRY